jgi:hypothetical protein
MGVACSPKAISFEYLLVQRIIEMLSVEEARNAVERLVVYEDRAEQCLLGVDIVGHGAVKQQISARFHSMLKRRLGSPLLTLAHAPAERGPIFICVDI